MTHHLKGFIEENTMHYILKLKWLEVMYTIGNTRVSVAYHSFYDNIQLYKPLGKALLFTSIS